MNKDFFYLYSRYLFTNIDKCVMVEMGILLKSHYAIIGLASNFLELLAYLF